MRFSSDVEFGEDSLDFGIGWWEVDDEMDDVGRSGTSERVERTPGTGDLDVEDRGRDGELEVKAKGGGGSQVRAGKGDEKLKTIILTDFILKP